MLKKVKFKIMFKSIDIVSRHGAFSTGAIYGITNEFLCCEPMLAIPTFEFIFKNEQLEEFW